MWSTFKRSILLIIKGVDDSYSLLLCDSIQYERRNRRRINYKFNETYFNRGIPLNQLVESIITFEELEILRLRYIKKLDQEVAAKEMRISQSQYQRDLSYALEKISIALIEGNAIKIEKPIAKKE